MKKQEETQIAVTAFFDADDKLVAVAFKYGGIQYCTGDIRSLFETLFVFKYSTHDELLLDTMRKCVNESIYKQKTATVGCSIDFTKHSLSYMLVNPEQMKLLMI